ncbi:Hypothetical protein D9617_13g101010 [Elsinoe fawcettii]|nr:Hypothetical protein D9617_13g101010 [Elsinoe fawcettii]
MPTGEAVPSDDNVKLLVDWDEVAASCDIVSGGAANKRYSRLLKQYNVNPNKKLQGSVTATTAKAKGTKTPKTLKTKDAVKDSGSGASGDDSPAGNAAQKEQKKRKAATPAKGNKCAKKVKQDLTDEDSATAEEGAGAEQKDEVTFEDVGKAEIEVEDGEVEDDE